MFKRKPKQEGHSNLERWLLTYSDMITLLLALFVMLYAMSSLDSAKFKALAEQLGEVLNPNFVEATPSGTFLAEQTPASPKPTGSPQASDAQQLKSRLESMIEADGLSASVSVRIEERGVVVSFVDALLFPSGSAVIRQEGLAVLDKMIGTIKSLDNYIRVEGSTDNVPITSSEFASNWELAAQRAVNVAKYLIQKGVDPSHTSTTSYGEYRPVAANDTEANKQLNRRVDIVFVDKSLNQYERGKE